MPSLVLVRIATFHDMIYPACNIVIPLTCSADSTQLGSHCAYHNFRNTTLTQMHGLFQINTNHLVWNVNNIHSFLGRLDQRYTFPRIHWFAGLGKMPGTYVICQIQYAVKQGCVITDAVYNFASLLTVSLNQSNKLNPEDYTALACSQLPRWPHASAHTSLHRVPAVTSKTKLRDASEE